MAEVTCYVDPDASGSEDGTSLANAYLSLSAAEAANFNATSVDLVTNTENVVCILHSTSGSADTTNVAINGFTTSPTYNIYIYVHADHRHAGVWTTAKCRLICAAYSGSALAINSENVTVEYLQVWADGGGSDRAIGCNGANSFLQYNIFKGFNTGAYLIYYYKNSTSTNHKFFNNLVINRNLEGLFSYDQLYMYNNTIIDCGKTGADAIYSYSSRVIAKNNICVGAGTAAFTANFHADSDYNLSDDTTGPGANSIDNAIVKDATTDTLTAAEKSTNNWVIFAAPASADYSLHSEIDGSELNDAIAAGTGVSLTYDIIGSAWGTPPSIGAFEYVAAGGTPTAGSITPTGAPSRHFEGSRSAQGAL